MHFLVVRDGTGIVQVVMQEGRRRDTFEAADHLSQETRSIDPRHGARRRAGQGRVRDRRTGMEVVGPAHDYPITPKEHGADFLMDHRHLWLRSERQTAILRVRDEVINAVRDFFDGAASSWSTRRSSRPAACEGHEHAVRGQVLRGRQGVPDADRAALQRGHRDGARQGVLLRADVPRREEQDAAAPDRVLDGRARDGVRRPRRRHGARRGLLVERRGARARQARRRSSTLLERDIVEARGGAGAVPADHLRRGGEDARASKGLPFEYGDDFGGADETVLSEQFDRPVWSPLSRRR